MAMDTAHRRYILRTAAFMTGYVAINMAAIGGAFDDRAEPGSWLLGLAVAAPVAGQLWATLALMRDADEFVRAVTAKRFIIASGLAMAIASAWGFVELYARAPHISAAMVYPLFWGLYGVVTPFVRTTRA
ncbi:hypothetical protein [Phenylobacterium sp.]|uniref:hypothetical protein n=1 Tax=Phenylobacterium sp. TaxID=1871053 RepID=UPI00391C0DAA